MFKVVEHFHDLEDSKNTKNGMLYHEYSIGDLYPRKGLKVSKERITELSSADNKQGKALIEVVENPTPEDNKELGDEEASE